MNRWLAEHLIWPATEALRRRDTVRRLRELEDNDHLDRGQLRSLQEHKLRRILRLADQHCPFYRERFREAGIDTHDPRLELDDLNRIPCLTRDDIRENLDALTWRHCPLGVIPYTTGGSSGEPLQFHFDRGRQAIDMATRWRARAWWGLRPGDTELLLWGSPVELDANHRLRQIRDRLLNQELLDAFDMSDDMIDDYIVRIRREQPRILYGYASSFALLARHAKLRGISLASTNLRAVFVTGEVLLEPDREVITEVFSAPVASEYGCRDGGLIACACPHGRLHVAQDCVIVELLDDDGRPVPPGHTGEVVITHLEATAMPIIRYRVGDLARETARNGIRRPCTCERASATLAEVQGRRTDQIIRRDGATLKRMHALSLIYVLREAQGLRQFRITQNSPDTLDIEVVTSERFTADIRQAVVHGLRERMGKAVDIRFHQRDHIPPTPSGKHACVISNIQTSPDHP